MANRQLGEMDPRARLRTGAHYLQTKQNRGRAEFFALPPLITRGANASLSP
jgi:hypothetical protein